MQAELQEALDLQHSWTSRRSDAMDRRGRLVRHEIAGWLLDHEGDLSGAVGIPTVEFLAEGRDGTGLKTRVPWTRFSSREESPSATEGFYVVYLFAFDGSAVYLSLNQGTTQFENGDFVRRPLGQLGSNVAWARSGLEDWTSSRGDLVQPELHDVGDQSLGRGYEIGNIAAVRYGSGAVPGDEALLGDAVWMAEGLGILYRAASKAPLPTEVPELVELEEAAEKAAGKPRPKRAGFRQSKEERDLIEKHAEDMAADYYAAQGWQVRRRGRPYDLELTRPDEKMTVEVKGTTSRGEGVALTFNEVEHHKVAHPDNALVVVRGIELDRTTSPPTVRGGELFERRPWTIDPEALKVVSYTYTLPDDFYA
jgi:hypothetical protein